MKTITRTLLIVVLALTCLSTTGCSYSDTKSRATNAWSTMTADNIDTAIIEAKQSIYFAVPEKNSEKLDNLADDAFIYSNTAYTRYFLCEKAGSKGTKAFLVLAETILSKGNPEERAAWTKLKESGAIDELKAIAKGTHLLQRKLAAEKKLAATN